MNERLMARESKQKRIHQLLASNSIVISIGANIPGEDKNIREAHLLMRLFLHVVKDQYNDAICITDESLDGPYALCVLNEKDSTKVKQKMMTIEESHPCGRFIDLDVHDRHHDHSISRLHIGSPARSCLICGDDVHVCRRLNRHPVDEILSRIRLDVEHYLNEIISSMIEDSITAELDLEYKFGLVTKSSSGSHQDMDYALMIQARDSLLPYLIKIFWHGYHTNDISQLLPSSRPLGIKAEQAMLEATGGVNCYKGLIFILGLALLSTGYTISHGEPFEAIFSHIKTMSSSLLDELKQGDDTIGKKMYKRYGSLGARGEAHLGFPSVIHALSIINHQEISDGLLRHILKEIALKTDDTVLIHRSKNHEQLRFFQEMLRHSDVKDDVVAKRITNYAVAKNLSLGGSADLLVVTLFLHQIRNFIL